MLAGAHSTGRTLFDAVCAGGAQAAGRHVEREGITKAFRGVMTRLAAVL
jgi:hypothetical protein